MMDDITNVQEATMPSRSGTINSVKQVKIPWQGEVLAILGIIGAVISGIFTALVLLLSSIAESILNMLSEGVNDQIKESTGRMEVSGYSINDLPEDFIDIVGTFNGVDFASKLPNDFGSYMFYAKMFAILFMVFQISMIIGFFKGKKIVVIISFIWLFINIFGLFMAKDVFMSEVGIVFAIIYAFFAYLHIACLRSKFYTKFI